MRGTAVLPDAAGSVEFAKADRSHPRADSHGADRL